MEAEIGVVQAQTVEQPKPPEAGRDSEWNFPRVLGGSVALLTS